MGLTFKENCPDLRNTRVIDMVDELTEYGSNVDVYDPWVDKQEAKHEYGLDLINNIDNNKYDAIILAVGHDQFKQLGAETIHQYGKDEHVVYDLKYILPPDHVDGRL
jgi:UDP-N-acetyl-D-galactosamine dehydrogenase